MNDRYTHIILGNRAQKFLPDNHCNYPTMSEERAGCCATRTGEPQTGMCMTHILYSNNDTDRLHLRDELKEPVFFVFYGIFSLGNRR